jgi:hypothetical protein
MTSTAPHKKLFFAGTSGNREEWSANGHMVSENPTAIGHRSSVIGHRSSVIGHRSSVIVSPGHQVDDLVTVGRS